LSIIELTRERQVLERTNRSGSSVGLVEDPEEIPAGVYNNGRGYHKDDLCPNVNGTSYLHSFTGAEPALSLAEFLAFCSHLEIDPRYKLTAETAFKIFICCCKRVEHYSSSVLHDVISAHHDELLGTRCSVREFFRMCSFLASKVTIRSDSDVQVRQSIIVAMEDKKEVVKDSSFEADSEFVELVDLTTLTDANPMQKQVSDVSSGVGKQTSKIIKSAKSTIPRLEKNSWIVAFSIAVCYPRFHVFGLSFKYISIFNALVHMVLVIQLCFVAADPPSHVWLDM
jgi:hypothetical protein